MRGSVIAVALVFASAVFAEPDLSGMWDLEMKWAGATETITSAGVCTFEHHGDRFSGSCGGGADKFPITGQIDGNRVSWRVDVKQSGSAGRMEFTGELDEQGTTIRGSCTIVGVQDGTFTMKKRPPPEE